MLSVRSISILQLIQVCDESHHESARCLLIEFHQMRGHQVCQRGKQFETVLSENELLLDGDLPCVADCLEKSHE